MSETLLNDSKLNQGITPYDFYSSYHQHPINKLIHFITIPLIVITTLNYFSTFSFSLANSSLSISTFYFTADILLAIFYILYYLTWGRKVGFVMLFYCSIMWTIAYFSRYIHLWLVYNTIIFVLAWIFQFAGHSCFEGNRPALLDSLSQAFLTAPAFSLDYVFPSLFPRSDTQL
jgi:uncharacterized membrane protein YGL010W